MTNQEEFAAASQLKWQRDGDEWVLLYRRRRLGRRADRFPGIQALDQRSAVTADRHLKITIAKDRQDDADRQHAEGGDELLRRGNQRFFSEEDSVNRARRRSGQSWLTARCARSR
jgi:hypothetical protein